MSSVPFVGVFLDIRTPIGSLLLRPDGAHHEHLATNSDIVVLVEAAGRRQRVVIPAGVRVKRKHVRLLRPRLLRRELKKHTTVFSPAAVDDIYVAAIWRETKEPLWRLRAYRSVLGVLGFLRYRRRYSRRSAIALD